MPVAYKYRIDKKLECQAVFRTADPKHPGVQMVMEQGEVNLGGRVRVLSDGGFAAKYGTLFMTPAETRAEFERLGWKRVAAFQTRNPMHRSHEYLAKVALEVCDGVLVHSLLGQLKPGDIPADVRTRAIALLIENYFRPGTVVQAGYPLDMRYAGPRDRGDENGRHLLLLPLLRHGVGTHLSPRRRRPAFRFGHAVAQMARGGQSGAAGVQPPRSPRSAARLLPFLVEVGQVERASG